uniref:CUB domain-containing protein n=1 Tax=Angiostrongylus cantonensis TaxID=6313 RepID=A0A0K0DAK3_ANGCA
MRCRNQFSLDSKGAWVTFFDITELTYSKPAIANECGGVIQFREFRCPETVDAQSEDDDGDGENSDKAASKHYRSPPVKRVVENLKKQENRLKIVSDLGILVKDVSSEKGT